MLFSLSEFARRHRYRVRNLHDGRPLLPLRVRVRRRGRSEGYVGDDDRMDAIIGRYGYVCDEGAGRLGWYLRRTKGKASALRALRAVGAVVHQDGDGEAAGDAAASTIDVVVEAIRPYLTQPVRPGHCPPRRDTGARIAAKGSEGVSVPPAPAFAPEVA